MKRGGKIWVAALLFSALLFGCGGGGGDNGGGPPPPPATLLSISVTPSNSSIAVGTTQKFIAIGLYSDGLSRFITTQVTWDSSPSGVVTISNVPGFNGLATAGSSPGSTDIIASLNGISGSAPLNVLGLSSISVTPANASIAPGTRIQYTAEGTLSDNITRQDLTTYATWGSSDTSIATVSDAVGSKGLATSSSINTGSTIITADFGGASGFTTLNVEHVSSIAITPANPSIPLGTSQQFVATGTLSGGSTQILTAFATWDSTVKTVATVSNISGSRGLAQSVAQGTTNIKATFDGVTNTVLASLTVTDAVLQSITVTPANPTIVLGGTQQFTATGTYTNGLRDITASVTWSSLNTNVATIGVNTGLATSVSTGSATIKAEKDGLSDITTLNVNAITTQSCNSIKIATPSASDGIYQIDPDGAGGLLPFDVYCDMTTDGGGWTLWASMVKDGTSSTGLITLTSSNYMDTTRYAALYSASTQFRARGQTTGKKFYLTKTEASAATCNNLSTSVPENVNSLHTTVYGHTELNNCTLANAAAYLSIGTGLTTLSVHSTSTVGLWHLDSPTGLQFNLNQNSFETKVEMYIK